jgi:hypothetical protein
MLLLQGAAPSKTSHMILNSVYTKLCALWTSNTTFFDMNAQSAPATTAISFLNGATSIKLPTPATWHKAYLDDPETKIMIDMITNPSTITKPNLLLIHYAYRQPMHERRIILLQKMLYIKESTDFSGNYIQLQIVPIDIRNIVFIAFHSNPIRCHIDTYRTFHRIHLRYHWPKMWNYVSTMIERCAGC